MIMIRQLNNTNSGFTPVREHVFVSNDLSMKNDGSVDIKKWQTDYKKGGPTPIAIHLGIHFSLIVIYHSHGSM